MCEFCDGWPGRPDIEHSWKCPVMLPLTTDGLAVTDVLHRDGAAVLAVLEVLSAGDRKEYFRGEIGPVGWEFWTASNGVSAHYLDQTPANSEAHRGVPVIAIWDATHLSPRKLTASGFTKYHASDCAFCGQEMVDGEWSCPYCGAS